jgi:hypothetical protein
MIIESLLLLGAIGRITVGCRPTSTFFLNFQRECLEVRGVCEADGLVPDLPPSPPDGPVAPHHVTQVVHVPDLRLPIRGVSHCRRKEKNLDLLINQIEDLDL